MDIKNFNNKLSKIHQGEKLVFGNGDLHSPVMLVGEAPGKDEILTGIPFVGAAGKNLDFFLSKAGIDRSRLYITNVIKYRLSTINNKTKNEINRPVTKTELLEERVYLLEEIKILKPKLIVTMGNSALFGVTGNQKQSIGSLHGTLFNIGINEVRTMLYPIYHPASLIYNQKLKLIYEQDLSRLNTLINELKLF